MLDKASLKGRIVANLEGLGFHPENSPWIARLAQAVADGVVDEITANAELVPLTTDSGPAGAGIITGGVK
jgi:hypothetical protein